VPSHPSSHHLDATLNSLSLLNIPDNSTVVLAHDVGDRSKCGEGYLQYLNDIALKYRGNKNIVITKTSCKKHLTGNVRKAFQYIDSKYVLVIQHDLPFIQSFDINKIMLDMKKNPEIKNVIFNKRQNLCIGDDAATNNNDFDLFGHQLKCDNYTYTRTPRWSDNNHLCLSSYYNDIILRESVDHLPMEFCIFYGNLKRIYENNSKDMTLEAHRKYGTYLFGELSQDPCIFHTNGYPKNNDSNTNEYLEYLKIINK